jgi:uncharacterized protein YqgC (DUF456 family)
MKTVLIVLSILGLILTVVPAFFVFAGTIAWTTHSHLMTAGMVLWFVTAPFWLGKKES